jgi:dTMP kinase
MLADRAQHVHEVIAPGLQAGKIVISDRFVDSTTAYQGYGRGIEAEFLARLNVFACGGYMPALTFLLDLPVAEGLRRIGQRRGGSEAVDHPFDSAQDKFEAESVAFHERVRTGFLEVARAEPERVYVVDAARSVEEIHQEILAVVLNRLAVPRTKNGRRKVGDGSG